MSLPRSCASTPYHGLSRRICKSGIRFALSILLGFLRHGWRPLNDFHAGEWEDASQSRIFPEPISFNGPHIRLFLGRLLPSRACLRLTGQLMSATCRPVHDCPAQNPEVLTSIAGLGQQARFIKRFTVFEQGPGDDQHLGGQFHPRLGFNAAFTSTVLYHAVINAAKAFIVV